ncbi:MAG: sulfite exporter TauE/SafE family protein [Bacteroidia bacterium]|nr:sulfite exporter TauE/SafE family protein [Bacteroidia bacterium]
MEAILISVTYALSSGLHCAGMCSPIFHVFFGKEQSFKNWLIYFTGKFSGYFTVYLAFLGTFHLLNITIPINYLHIAAMAGGILMIVFIIKDVNVDSFNLSFLSSKFNSFLKKISSPGIKKFLLAYFNGIIPCHLSYFLFFLVAGIYNIQEGLMFIFAFHAVSVLWIIFPNAILGLFPIRNRKVSDYIQKSMLIVSVVIILFRSYQGIRKDYPLMKQNDKHSVFCVK